MSSAPAVPRFALYYAPPRESVWWQAGCEWLQRDPETGEALAAPCVDGLDPATLTTLTSEPRRYGWHATIYPPFRCGESVTPEQVLAATTAWAARQTPFELLVTAARLDRFVALRPSVVDGDAATRALAADAVEVCHALRAMPGEAEIEQRGATPLTPRQSVLLATWGYPYLFDEYRFHMTLSNSIDDEPAEALLAWWQPRMAALGAMPVTGAALFMQPAPGEPFVLWRRLPFAGGV